MSKKKLSFLLFCTVIFSLFATIFAAPTSTCTYSIEPNKKQVSRGDIVTFTVYMQQTGTMNSLEGTIVIPNGLKYIKGSGKIASGVSSILKWTGETEGVAWTESSMLLNGYGSVSYTGTSKIALMTFQCRANLDAKLTTYKIELKDCVADDSNYNTKNPTVTSTAVTVKDFPELPFDDVSKSAWYYKTIQKVYVLGLMTGTTATTFEPESPMTRAMVVSVLHRMAGKPQVEYQSLFKDVPNGKWYTKPVIWAATNKIVSGYTEDNTFRPDDNITREQVAVIIRNYVKSTGIDTTSSTSIDSFKDVKDVSSWAKSAICWAVENGIMSGTTDGYLNPQKNATRAECAKMLLKAYELLEEN